MGKLADVPPGILGEHEQLEEPLHLHLHTDQHQAMKKKTFIKTSLKHSNAESLLIS